MIIEKHSHRNSRFMDKNNCVTPLSSDILCNRIDFHSASSVSTNLKSTMAIFIFESKSDKSEDAFNKRIKLNYHDCYAVKSSNEKNYPLLTWTLKKRMKVMFLRQ